LFNIDSVENDTSNKSSIVIIKCSYNNSKYLISIQEFGIDNKSKINPTQFAVTQKNGTEPPFKNEFWDSHKEGIYVDVVSGEPLFSSIDKFDSGCGWPSFSKPINPRYIEKKEDNSAGMQRVETRSRFGDSHLGHVFDDGPSPTHLRYCINSASLRFIPKEDLQKEGYAEFLYLFK